MNPAAVIAELSKIMAERIADACSQADGDGSGLAKQKKFEQAGFSTSWAYCEAKDIEYQVCDRAMKAGEE